MAYLERSNAHTSVHLRMSRTLGAMPLSVNARGGRQPGVRHAGRQLWAKRKPRIRVAHGATACKKAA
jgi:hypothetical protein